MDHPRRLIFLLLLVMTPSCSRGPASEVVGTTPALSSAEVVDASSRAINANISSEDNSNASATATAPPRGSVAIIIGGVESEVTAHHVLVNVEAAINNLTGSTLQVRSNFGSPFDGLSLVVTSPGGVELGRQGSAAHQSPYSLPGELYPLPPGATEQVMGFPLFDISLSAGQPVGLQLVGGLAETPFASGLESNLVTTTIGAPSAP